MKAIINIDVRATEGAMSIIMADLVRMTNKYLQNQAYEIYEYSVNWEPVDNPPVERRRAIRE